MKITRLLLSLSLGMSIAFQPALSAPKVDSAALGSVMLVDSESVDDTTDADDTLPELAAPSSAKADSIVADSLKKAVRRDSLIAEKSRAMAVYQSFPVSLDSIIHPFLTRRQAIFSSDVIDVSEVARNYPSMVAAPFSLSNNLNRCMPYGFPLPGLVMAATQEIHSSSADAYTGTDRLSSTQISGLSLDPLQRLRLTPNLDDCVAPETDFLWETGLFYENILNVRFVRPLSPTLSFGIFSNNRYFKSLKYSTKNDIKSLYGYFVTDTNMLAQGAINPLVEDQNTELRFSSYGKHGERRNFSVSYHDEKNEIAFQQDSGATQKLRWDRISQYGTIADAGYEGLRLKPLFIDAQLHVESGGHTRYNPLNYTQRMGRSNEYSLVLKPYIPLRSDTLLAIGGVTRNDETVYDQTKRSTMREDVSIGVTHHGRLRGVDLTISGTIGECFLSQKISGLNKYNWTGAISAEIELKRQMVRAFTMRATTPYPSIYDSASTLLAPYLKMYESYGAEYFGRYKKIGVMAGICGVSGLGNKDSLYLWPSNVLPYKQPKVSYVLSPLFGQWHGLSAASRWMMSDSRPYLKAQTSLSYQAHPLEGREHFLIDLVYDYWSTRDKITYGADSSWNKELNSLSLKIAVQIKTFSLFYKVDNILNRKFDYVPGYWMPGLTFRWGFQWMIQG